MIHRFALGLAALAALAVPSAAFAADLAEYPMVPEGPECARHGAGRPYDDVYQPPQVAYIVASRCSSELDLAYLFSAGQRQKIIVYYNGGSMTKTDLDLIVVGR